MAEFKKDFLSYLNAFRRDWLSLMSGIVSVILLFAGLFWPIRRWEVFLAAVICYIVASFRVWRTANKGLKTAEGSLAEFKAEAKKQIANAERQVAEEKDRRLRAEKQLADEKANKIAVDEAVLRESRKEFPNLIRERDRTTPIRAILNDAWIGQTAQRRGFTFDEVLESIDRLNGKFHWQ